MVAAAAAGAASAGKVLTSYQEVDLESFLTRPERVRLSDAAGMIDE